MAFYLEHVFIVADTFLRLLLLYFKCKILSSAGTFLLFGITFFFFFFSTRSQYFSAHRCVLGLSNYSTEDLK